MVLNRYITCYVTKSEKTATKELWGKCNRNTSLRSCFKSFALKSLKSRQIGIYEAEIDQNQLNQNIRNLNKRQREVFEQVVDSIEHQR
jgi:hypothetical protein